LVQIFGPYHDKNYRIIKGKFSPYPEWYLGLAEKIQKEIPKYKNNTWINDAMKYTDPQKTEIYVNKYESHNGLRPHFDNRTTYDEVICGVSLQCDCKITFIKGSSKIPVNIPKGSLYLMTGDSRKKYKHSITPGDIDGTRISITIRST
jgi:alkylated DNA repair dioxygenase AlkB